MQPAEPNTRFFLAGFRPIQWGDLSWCTGVLPSMNGRSEGLVSRMYGCVPGCEASEIGNCDVVMCRIQQLRSGTGVIFSRKEIA